MLEPYLLTHPWVPALLWVVLYTSDHFLTLWGARLYKRQGFFQHEGSYEMTPEHQDDIDNQRRFSPKFVGDIITGSVMLFIVGLIAPVSPKVYGAIVGWFIFPQIAVHMRHADCIDTYRYLSGSNPGVTGSVVMSSEYSYRSSSFSTMCMGVFALLLFAFTGSYFFLGGSLACLHNAHSHYELARRYATQPAPTETATDTPVETTEETLSP